MVQSERTTSPDAGPLDSGPPDAPRTPASVPVQPAPRPKGGSWRKWRARFVVLVLLAAAVLLFVRISANRATESNRVTLTQVTLTAQAIPVEPTRTGQVTAIAVTPLQRVSAGQRVGTIEVTTTRANGDPRTTKVNLTAPRAGIVIDVPVQIGTTLQPGQSFLQLYDPAQLTFVTEVAVNDLSVIAPTMSAVLRTEGVDRAVHATVQRIVPRVEGARSTSGTNPGALQVVLVPASARDVQGLVPGLRFTGYVDTVSGKPGNQRLVSMPGVGGGS